MIFKLCFLCIRPLLSPLTRYRLLTRAENHFQKLFLATDFAVHHAAKNQLNKPTKLKTVELSNQIFERRYLCSLNTPNILPI